MTKFPRDWDLVPFPEAVEIVSDGGRRVPAREYQSSGQVAVVDQGDGLIGGWTDDVAAKYQGDLPVIVFGDHTRRFKFVDFSFAVGAQGVKLLRARKDDPKYIFWALQAAHIPDRGYGRHFGLLRSVHLPIPPLSEQKRIVAAIEEQFSRLDAGRASLAEAAKKLDVLNTRIAASICLGGAVGSQLGEGWTWQTVADVCPVFVDCEHRTPHPDEAGVPALRPRDIVGGILRLDEAMKVDQAQYRDRIRRRVPAPGDVIYSRELSYGWAVVVPSEPRLCLGQGLVLMRPDDRMRSEFLRELLNSTIVRAQARRAATGTANPHINLRDIKAYRIPVPPLKEQGAALARLSWLNSVTVAAKAELVRSTSRARSLRSAILHEAFAGHLVTLGSTHRDGDGPS